MLMFPRIFSKEVSNKKLKDEGLDFKKTIVVTSPLRRCKKLAKKICITSPLIQG